MKRPLMSLLVIALLVGPLSGTTLVKKNLAQLAAEAEAIVLADVVGTRCSWNAGRTLIWTTSELRVRQTWKGQVPESVAVMEPGGIVHPIGQKVPGMARYRAGDKVVVFLKKDKLGQWRTHGCVQGAFPVVKRKDGSLAPSIGKWTRHVVKGHVANDVGLHAFETRVKALVAKGRRGK